MMICADPSVIRTTSFQLSATATGGLVTLTVPLQRAMQRATLRRRRFQRSLYAMLAVNLAATASTAITSAVLFASMSIVSPLANLVVVPLMSAGMLMSTAMIVGHLLHPAIASLFAGVATLTLVAADHVTRAAAALQPSATPGSAVITAFVIAASILWLTTVNQWRHVAGRACAMIVAVVIALHIAPPAGRTVERYEREDCTVIFYPLRGDRTLVRIIGRQPDAGIRDIALSRECALRHNTIVRRGIVHATASHLRGP
jgi:competence protein ComEC